MAKTQLSRQQKDHLSRQQLNIWQQLAAYERDAKQYGEPFTYLHTLNQMMDEKLMYGEKIIAKPKIRLKARFSSFFKMFTLNENQ